MKIKPFFSLVFVVFFLCSCARTAQDPSQRKPIADYEVALDQNLSLKKEEVTGTGKLRFQQPLLGMNSREHYILGFRFLSSRSKITLHSHFSGFYLEDGVKIEIFSLNDRLQIRLSAPGTPMTKSFELFPFHLKEEVLLDVEVHDGASSGVHVLIWNGLISYKGEVRRRQERLYAGNADFDSEEEGLNFLDSGHGMRWGIEMTDADLTRAQRQAAYVD